MELSNITIDPEIQKLIPPLTTEERHNLEASLLADGCISPLVVWHKHNILLDGHNRHAFCVEHDIECEVHEIVLGSREDAKAWVIKHQLGRRNLTESQRALLATALEDVYGQQAKTRQMEQARRNQPQAKKTADSPPLVKSRARDQAAAELNVSPRLVQTAKKVRDAGTQKLQDAVRDGNVSVSVAAEVAQLPKAAQDRLVESGPKAIREAARDIRKGRSKGQDSPDAPDAVRPRVLTEKQIVELARQVRELKRLTDVPSMEYSPIHIRKVVAEIVRLVL